MTRVLPYGTWPPATDPAAPGAAPLRLGQLLADGEAVLWVESRPGEEGRSVLVRWTPGGAPEDLTGPPWNVRTRVHEYGGGAVAAAGGLVCFSHDRDQRVYRLEPRGGAPQPITPAGPCRYADGTIDRRRGVLFAVCEDHGAGGHEPRNTIVRIPLEGDRPPRTVVQGHDFYAAPRLSPDGSRLAWLAWNHPHMPWDESELWLAELDRSGEPRAIHRIAGGKSESVLQPSWSPTGALHWVSDASGWWNLWRLGGGGPVPCWPMEAEFAVPPWSLGVMTYGFAVDGAIVCAFTHDGRWRLARLDERCGPVELPCAWTEIGAVAPAGARLALRAAAPDHPEAIVVREEGGERVLRNAVPPPPDPASVAVAETLWLPSEGGRTVHALFYPPRHAGIVGPSGERAPCIVRAHGGPTGAAFHGFDPAVQGFTSRGFAVLDVNYAGSTGFGRAYRTRLDGGWGVVDVEDVCAAARGVAAAGRVDGKRLVVRGASAGGFTALCAAAHTPDLFRGVVSWYGIADLEALLAHTHKFEACVERRLVAPYPEGAALYRARSPLAAAGRFRCPVLLLQGREDPVVPPEQARAFAAALREHGIRCVHVEFGGEGHGFRRAGTVRRALCLELAFVGLVLRLPVVVPERLPEEG